MTAHQFLARLTEHYSVFVAVDAQDEPIGFIELRTKDQNGYIDCFYCHPDYAHQGIGRQLYDTLFKEAQTQGIQQLQVHSSLAVKSFFMRRGFEEIRKETVTRNGCELHNFLMQKTL